LTASLQTPDVHRRRREGDLKMRMNEKAAECCPRFDPAPWDEKTVTWEAKPFLQARVRSFLHMPLDFGVGMRKSMAMIEAAGASPDEMVVLSDENSLWGADVYIAIAKDIPGANTTTVSGTFLAKVFEGPYRNMRNWIETMHAFVTSRGKDPRKLYLFYTTCPKCAKKYGKNYVVILAQVAETACNQCPSVPGSPRNDCPWR
jgi:hypothetical protein